ncbi:MAG: hypothetical protein ACOY3D_05045 [Candidatus Omnitrophota bacterium]
MNWSSGIPLKSKTDLLAVGGETKNTFALVKGNQLWKSGDNGNLEELDNLLRFERKIGAALKKFELGPRRLLADLHPEYLSTKFAQDFCRRRNLPLEYIQHHHAHAASCAFENNQTGKGIGVIFDGTGYGDDEKLWGGEFLIFDFRKFRRYAHLKYIPLVGGSKPIKEPWRLAVTWLYEIYGQRLGSLKIDFVRRWPARKISILMQMLDRQINCPLASSMGRLFDAIAAIIGIKNFAAYEAEAAVALEKSAAAQYPKRLKPYKFSLEKEAAGLIINPIPLFKAVIANLKSQRPTTEIALKFHYAVAQMIKEVCLKIRRKENLNRIFLSGGVFQNKILTQEATGLLEGAGFKVFKNLTSPSDSSLSIGQAAIGAYRYSH